MYIVDLACISPQHTFSGNFLSGDPVSHSGTQYEAQEPDYKGIISTSALRRMAKALRMGVGAGAFLLNRNPKPDGIVFGTAYGGLDHCLKFLNQIVEYNETTLTPTNFVQSTPNNIAAQLSLMSSNSGYNMTHVHKGLAFETALMDAMLFLEEDRNRSLLIGATEEISAYNFSIDEQAGLYKKEHTTSASLLTSGSPGTVCGEGASVFMVQGSGSSGYMAKVMDVAQLTYPEMPDLEETVHTMLRKNGLTPADIKGYIAGFSGDARTDFWYQQLNDSLFPQLKPVAFKHLTGDYPTASAFALWLGCQLLRGTRPPGYQKPDGPVLIYNHYSGIQHGLILLDS